MLYIIGYLLFSILLIGIAFHIIEHSPTGWEDENGFHAFAEPAPKLKKPVIQHSSYFDIFLGSESAHYTPHHS